MGYGGTTAAYGEFLNVGWKYGAQPRRLLTFAIGGTATIPASAIDLLICKPSLIKRPVLEHNGKLHLGFKEADYQEAFGK